LPEATLVLAAQSSWVGTLVVALLLAGVGGVLVLNARSRRRFHESNGREFEERR
jgi:uncharacterized protein YigA (DUF484 family)